MSFVENLSNLENTDTNSSLYFRTQMEWMLEENVEMNMDWCVVESREHAYLADLMESLEMGFGADANIEMEDIDTLEEE